MQYKLIKENPDYLIIDKPAGLLVHGAEHIKEETLIDQILKNYPEIAKIGDDPMRPGLMHRLDRLVSGIMAIARTQDSFDDLKQQFQNRTINKIYTALVYGKIEADEAEINFPIKRSRDGKKQAAIPITNKGELNTAGRQALTEFWVEKKFINYTLLKVKIKTGRMHQIRVHMAAYGHPVVGDELYSTKKTRAKNAKLQLPRIFLHSSSLEFLDLSGAKQNFTSDLPDELAELLLKIK